MFVALPPDRTEEPVREFGTFTADLNELADWLIKHGVTTVAMESTGVFWIPLFQILESRGLEVFLVNARHAKTVPGRKTDVRDCQWLQYLHSVGLLSASYRPAQEIAAIRSVYRHRQNKVRAASRCIQHMQKAMQQMNLQLHHVISDISGETGLAIITAIVQGERDPHKLAKLRNRRIKASEERIFRALQGDYRAEHIFVLKQALSEYQFHQKQILEIDQEIARITAEFNRTSAENIKASFTGAARENFMRQEMKQAFGVDLLMIPTFGIETVLTVFSEVGPDFSKFRSAGAFASWLTLCPDPEKTGGKVKRTKTRQSKSRTAQALRNAAQSLAREKGYYGELYRRLRAKMGPQKAITAMAHRLARLLYHLVTTKQEFSESKFAEAASRHRVRRESSLRRAASALGYNLVPAT